MESNVTHRFGPSTVPLMGLDVAAISERDTIDYVLRSVAERRGGWICTANLDILRQWHDSAEVRRIVSTADMVVADGMPLLWAGTVQGSPLPERVAGSALVLSLTAAAAEAGASIFLIGGNPGVAEDAVGRLTSLFPDAHFRGTLCPPFGFEADQDWLDSIAGDVVEAAPDVIFVGLGFPKQERLILALRERLPTAFFVPCGISFSFVSGEIPRAPRFMQHLGLEWLHRLAMEPKRLYRRYLIQGLPFLVRLMWAAARTRSVGRRVTSVPLRPVEN